MSLLDTAANQLSSALGKIGAQRARLSVSMNVLAIRKENYTNASSRIRDVDVAEESANLIKAQTIQNVSASILAQANQLPQLAFRFSDNIA